MRRAAEFSSLFIDFNSYFASVEQQHDPLLRGKPVIVAPLDSEHTSAIAASFEAKALGITMGMKVREARQLCPGLAVRVANPRLYVEYHKRLMAEIERHAPIDKVHSIDEACCRLVGRQCSAEAATALAGAIKAGIAANVGPAIRCSIGIAATPLLGKIASDLQKPDALVLLPVHDMPERLAHWRLRDIAGIGFNMERRLNAAGITDIAGLWALEPKRARAIWNSVAGERFWYALHGYEVPDLETHQSCIGHSRVLDPQWRMPDRARLVMRELALKAARRLRRHDLAAGAVSLTLRHADGARREAMLEFPATQDSLVLLRFLEDMWQGLRLYPRHPVKNIAIMLHGLTPMATRTGDLFTRHDPAARRREKLWSAIDHLRSAHGLKVGLASQEAVHLQDLGTKIAFTRIPELAEFME